jgi:hypothetical protein
MPERRTKTVLRDLDLHRLGRLAWVDVQTRRGIGGSRFGRLIR